MVADGLSMINADYSSTSFRVSRVSIGPRNFLGNNIAYPAQGRTGDNCLLATKVMVPLDGKIREGVGLLGSPELRDPPLRRARRLFDHLKSDEELGATWPRRTGTTCAPWACFCSSDGCNLFLVTLLGMAAADLYDALRAVVGAFLVLSVLLQRGLLHVRRTLLHGIPPAATPAVLQLRPVFLVARTALEGAVGRLPAYLQRHPVQERDLAAAGCPARPQGLRRRLLPDRNGPLSPSATTPCSMRAARFSATPRRTAPSSPTTPRIGADCTLGVGAFVHYGVTMGDGAVLAPDSFLMKGEEVPPHAQWAGNPAVEIPADLADSPQSGRVTEWVPAREVQSAGRHRRVVEPVHTQPVRSAGRHRRNVSPDRPPRDVTAGTHNGADQPDQRAAPPGLHGPSAGGLPRRRQRTAETAIHTSLTTAAPAWSARRPSPMALVREGKIRWER